MNPLSIGVVGCGGIGQVHLTNYKLHQVNISAISDINIDYGQKIAEKYNAKFYTDYRKMFEKEKLDAISICTPPVSHCEIAQEAFIRKIHVLCEKPLAMNFAQADIMVNSARKNDVILMTAFCHRFQWQNQMAKNTINSGDLGKPVLYYNRFASLFNDVEKKWFSQKEISGGGLFMDTIIHSIDLFRYLIGDIKSVQAKMYSFHPKLTVEDSGMILLQSVDDTLGMLSGSWMTPISENLIEILCSKGTIHINYNQNNMKIRLQSDSDWTISAMPQGTKDRFYQEIEHFIDCIKNVKNPMVTGLDGLKAIEVCEQSILSAGDWINFNQSILPPTD